MRWRALLLGLVAFALALLAVLPVRWVAGLLPASVQCGQWRGTVWHGLCHQFAVRTRPGEPLVAVESLGWAVHPLMLLRARLAADLVITDSHGDAEASVELARNGLVSLRGLSARALLDRQLIGSLPAAWHGRLEVGGLDLDWQGKSLLHLQGLLRVLDLRGPRDLDLGSYRLSFPPATAAPFTAALADDGGPLEAHGTLRVAGDFAWTLDGTVAPRAGTGTDLAQYLDVLGPPDAAGRRPLSAAGTFE